MIEKSKKRKKGIITEEDISTLLQRYTANTVLALLQEVGAECEGVVKIDWNALVKKTTTGITNVREYQMLWRHLAYRHALIDDLDDSAQPLDDDSDLEYELEVFPDVSSDASAEAAACVKVLVASGLPSDSSHPNGATVEAPLTINIPNGQSGKSSSANSTPATMRGMNITVPVSVQKQHLPSVSSSEGLDVNGLSSGNFPPRRKRKPWTEVEDNALITAVQKLGEGNWAQILRSGSEYPFDRTTSQLSQRWTLLRKKKYELKPAGNPREAQITEAQRAARHAMNLALNSPTRKSFKNSFGEAASTQPQSQRPSAVKSSPVGPSGSAADSQITIKKSVTRDLSSDPVRDTAVAVGARIASPSDAASLFKAAQGKNAIHIMPAGSSSIKSPTSSTTNRPEAHPNVRNNDVAAASCSTLPVVSPSGPCPTAMSVPQNTRVSEISRNTCTKQSFAGLPSKKDAEMAGGMQALLEDVSEQQVKKENGARVLGNDKSKQIHEEKIALHNREAESKPQVAPVENGKVVIIGKQNEGCQNSNCDKDIVMTEAKGCQTFNGKKEENHSAVAANNDSSSINLKPVQTSTVTDAGSEKVQAVSTLQSDVVMKDVEV